MVSAHQGNATLGQGNIKHHFPLTKVTLQEVFESKSICGLSYRLNERCFFQNSGHVSCIIGKSSIGSKAGCTDGCIYSHVQSNLLLTGTHAYRGECIRNFVGRTLHIQNNISCCISSVSILMIFLQKI